MQRAGEGREMGALTSCPAPHPGRRRQAYVAVALGAPDGPASPHAQAARVALVCSCSLGSGRRGRAHRLMRPPPVSQETP